VKAILEDSGIMGNINPNLGFNFPTKTIMKIVRIIHSCLQPSIFFQPTMSYVIDEINGALQLEEGLKAEEGAMNTEIPQYASQSKTYASIETILDHEFESQKTFDDISDFERGDIYHYDMWTSYRFGFVKPYSNLQ